MNNQAVHKLISPNIVKDVVADTLCGCCPDLQLERCGEQLYHLVISYELPQDGRQDDCAVTVTAGFTPSFCWLPQLTPEDGYIAQQHIFRTPAAILRSQAATLVLIPDMEAMDTQKVQCYLDLDAKAGTVTLGMCESQVVGHILYKKAAGARYPRGRVQLAFYLIATPTSLENPFRPVLEHFWSRAGKRDYEKLVAPKRVLEPYVQHTYRWAFEHWKEVVWQSFEINGIPVGAPVFIVTTTQSPNYGGVRKERELRSIWNQAWFCSLRSASGLYRYAWRTNNQKLLDYARQTKELALSFPQDNGLFDSVVATEMEEFTVDGKAYMRSLGWDTRYYGNSDRNPFGLSVKDAPRHLLDMSFTADHMLMWYKELERDTRLLEYATRYADRLIELQNLQGFYYGWVDRAGNPMGVLDNSPESAMSAAFLLHLYEITNKPQYLTSALRAIDAVCSEIVPVGRWEDFETYWSCSAFWNDKVGQKIPRNDMYKQCNFSTYFTALALLEASRITGENRYLQTGRMVLDELLMTQSSYQPTLIPIPVVGGFGVLNADAELNDARQSLFSELIMQYGQVLDEPEYQERALAALRISFSMMYCPENPEAKLQWEKAWPFLGEQDYGFNMENYGHNGKVDGEGLGIGEFTIYDWGNGAASESYERMLAHFGDALIHQ